MAGPTDSFLSLSYSILFNRLLTSAGRNQDGPPAFVLRQAQDYGGQAEDTEVTENNQHIIVGAPSWARSGQANGSACKQKGLPQ